MHEQYDDTITTNVLAKFLPQKIVKDKYKLAKQLYDTLRPVSWESENNLARQLNVSRRQIVQAKALLEKQGRVIVNLEDNGARKNPKHILIKVIPKPKAGPNTYHKKTASGPCQSERETEAVGHRWEALALVGIHSINAMSKVEAVELYLQAGLHPIPLHYPIFHDGADRVQCSCRKGIECDSIGKHPKRGYKNLDFTDVKTQKRIKNYWKRDPNHNIGLVCDNFSVIDIDYRKFGHNSLAYAEEELGPINRTLTVKTGNGEHLYVENSEFLNNATNLFGLPGLDVRANGGYVAAPQSTHHTGNTYQWTQVGPPSELGGDWLPNLEVEFQKDGPGDKSANKHKSRKAKPKSPQKQSPLSVMLRGPIRHGYRNNTLFRYGCWLRGQGKTEDEIFCNMKNLYERQCEKFPPISDDEILKSAKSAASYPTNAEKSLQQKYTQTDKRNTHKPTRPPIV